jgi:hypothetical protein
VPYYPSRRLTSLALDPSVRDSNGILRTQIEIPNEVLDPGPRGYRVHVINYDSSTDTFRQPARLPAGINTQSREPLDPFKDWIDAQLLASPLFRTFMTYGIIMKTLARFEFALGRRLSWGFGSHQIQVAPHAFSDANAFYGARTLLRILPQQ